MLSTSVSKDSEISRRRVAVMRVVDRLMDEARDLCVKQLDNTKRTTQPHHDTALKSLVDVLVSLRPVIHHRLYFSPTLQYLYATQMARRAGSDMTSGESIEALEQQLLEAQQRRECELSRREAVIAGLTNTLKDLDAQGSRAVRKCRREARLECEEVRAQSEISLEQLKASLAASKASQQQQTERHSHDEAVMRERRQQLEAEMQQVIRRYDITMSRLQTQLDGLRDEHTHLTQQLEQQTAALSIVEARYRSILEEKQRQEEERLAAMQAEFRREHAARIIQRAWHHYKMRKMLKKAQRKRKKKPKDVK